MNAFTCSIVLAALLVGVVVAAKGGRLKLAFGKLISLTIEGRRK